MKIKRRVFSSLEKFNIIKEFLKTDTGVSEICSKHQIHSSQFYKWQDTFFEGAIAHFEKKAQKQSQTDFKKIESLESENNRMKDVIAEITSENIQLKKKYGGL